MATSTSTSSRGSFGAAMRTCETCHTPYRSEIEFCGLDGTRLRDAGDADPLVGVEIDRYRILARLGGGGMASVYQAAHTVIDREVALKILYGELASNKDFAERFRREALAASKIKHKNVVEVLDFGTTPQGASFLIMELLRGHTLGHAIGEAGAFSPARAALVLRDVACGLQAAHELGFVHRDLKPGNIILVDDPLAPGSGSEVAKIVDFGLVAAVASKEGGPGERKLTETGQTLGTPHYMAPEQIMGAVTTAQSDLYSLGVVLHEMLAGDSPFRGSLGEILTQHASEPPPKLAPAQGLERIAVALMQKDPINRPKSAAALVALLDGTGLIPPARQGPVTASSTAVNGAARGIPPTLARAAGAPTESALPSATSLDGRRASRAPLAIAAAVVVGAAGVVAWRNIDRLAPLGADTALVDAARAIDASDVAETRDALASAAVGVGQALVGAVQSPRIVDAGVAPDAASSSTAGSAATAATRASLVRIERDIDTARSARGLVVDDARALPAVAAPLTAWRAAADANDVAAARAAADAVVAELARARIDQALLRSKLARVATLIEDSSARPKRKALWQAKHRLLSAAVKPRLSEAECGRLMLKVSDLERDVGER